MTIHTMIFDVGQVLLEYDPYTFLGGFIEEESDKKQIMDQLFRSPLWQALDAGSITEQAAIEQALEKLPHRLHAAAKYAYENWHTHLKPVPGMEDILRALWEAKYPIYLLSNFSVRFELMRKDFWAMPYVTGDVISHSAKGCKPGLEIYRLLLEKYSLAPQGCLFVDDMEENILAAKTLGIEGIVYRNAAQLKKELSRLKVLP